MKIKRLLSLVVAAAMTVSMLPSLVLAKGFDYEPDEPEAVETSEPNEKEETKPEAKEPSTPEAEEPDDTKEGEPAEPKTEEPAETKEEPSETKGEEPCESKAEEPVEPETEQPADEKEEEPADTKDEKPAEDVPDEDETISEEALKGFKVTVPDISIKVSGSKDNDELFNRYVESKFGLSSSASYRRKATVAGTQLTGLDKILYNQLKPQIKDVADGKNASTKFKVEPSTVTWNSKQLGGVALFGTDPGTGKPCISEQAKEEMKKKLAINAVINALLADCPYELYWFDKEKSIPITDIIIGAKMVNGVPALYFASLYIAFPVEKEYAANGDEYKINGTKIERVNTSIKNAGKIVEAAKSKSTDYEKLLFYSQQICNLVEYDHAAADDNTMPYGDPWQLVSVFDGDIDTNVVCEGYSKAFKYLCDQTSFKSNKISCILATGIMKASKSGGHMWNIVKMEDGKNYLVDVTNCDNGTIGYPDKLFLAGYAGGNKTDGYSFKCGSGIVFYTYDTMTTSTFSSDLVLTNLCYLPAGLSGKCGDNLEWSISGHTLTISGTGDMTNFSYYSDGIGAPWEKYALGIQNVVISDGVTSIGNNAFYCFAGIKSIKLPYSLTRIGEYAFAGCVNLTGIKIPNTVEKIGANAFYRCVNLTRVTIEESLHKKVTGLFDTCPKAVFYDYQVLGNYELQITNPAVNGTGTATLVGMASPTGAVTIPASVADTNGDVYKINRIASDAFYQDKTIRTLYIGSNVVTIDGNAFYGCSNLYRVSGGTNLKVIGSNSFAYCSKLSSFTVTSKVLNKIGAYAFNKDSKLKTLNIKKTKKLSKSGVKNSLKGSSVKTVKVKKSKIRKYKKYFKKSNSGRKVKVKK